MVTLWIICSGIGGYIWQDRWEHYFRNAIFMDLVNYPWPAIEAHGYKGPAMICYYIGFWMPAALFGKICHSAEAGYAFQLIYAIAGALIAILMIYKYLGAKKFYVGIALIFMLYGGWDILAWLLFKPVSRFGFCWEMKDLSCGLFSAPGATIECFYIYNQGIAGWLAMMLLLNHKDKPQILVYVYSLLALFSPIICAAIAPALAIKVLSNPRKSLTGANLTGMALGLIVLAYYGSNSRVQGIGIQRVDSYSITMYIAAMTLNFGVYIPFVWARIKHDRLFWALALPMLLMSWVSIGNSADIGWRCTIPTAFYLMLTVIREYIDCMDRWNLKRTAMLAVICIGAMGCFNIAYSRGAKTYKILTGITEEHARNEALPSVLKPSDNVHPNCTYTFQNFSGYDEDSFFVRYLMR